MDSTELVRKRSRSSSPGSLDPAAKKHNPDSTSLPSTSNAPTPPTTLDAPSTETKMALDSELPPKPEQASEELAPEDSQPAQPASISMRALIVTQDASIIIGKQGKNVNEIRDKSGSKITITEAVPGNPERVMVVAGQLDAVSKAFGLVVRRINDEPFDVPSVPGSRAVTIRFIIPNSRMGSVIGKAGSKIKEIQEASGARLQASEAMLPGSTERVLSVSGVADAIHIAVYYIGTILQEHPITSTSGSGSNTSYRPNSTQGSYSGGNGGGDYQSRPPRDNRDSRDSRDQRGPPQQNFSNAPPPGSQAQQIYIPNELVGSIIGKGGQKINEIRQLSSCQIKICEPGEASPGADVSERLVTITGQSEGIQIAIGLLYQRLESEKQKQMGN